MNRVVRVTVVLIALGFSALFLLDRSDAAPLKVGDAAPALSLPDESGTKVSLSDFAGKIVVLEWVNPDCPFVQRHGREGTMRDLAVKYAGKEVVWLGVNSTHYMDQAHNKSWIAQAKLPYSILDDGTGAVGKAYGARTTPHMFVIDPNGKLAYQGAIDDDRSGSKSERIQYLDSAISDLLAGRSVQIAETKPYGCSVKYAS